MSRAIHKASGEMSLNQLPWQLFGSSSSSRADLTPRHRMAVSPGSQGRSNAVYNGINRGVSGRSVQVATANGAVVNLDPSFIRSLNTPAPLTRKAIREARKAETHRSQLVASVSLAALVGMTATSAAFSGRSPILGGVGEASTTITRAIRPAGSAAASRSADRESSPDTKVVDKTEQTLSQGTWQLHDAGFDVGQMSKSTAANPRVAAFMDADADSLPAGFNPNHSSGDSGNAYEFSQCTWWVYVRRQQLGLPVGSRFGNGNMWAVSARSLGYWVDTTARHPGDIMVFNSGQDGSDPQYGHVAIIESINPDGSVQTSECGSSYNGKTYSRTFTAAQVSQHQIIHY